MGIISIANEEIGSLLQKGTWADRNWMGWIEVGREERVCIYTVMKELSMKLLVP